MANTQSVSILAKKLNTFVPLSPDELTCLAEIQRNPLKVKRGKQLTLEGQTGHKAFVLHDGWACSYKTAAQRRASDHLLSDRWGLCRAAQRPATNGGSFLLGFDGCGRQSGGRHARLEVCDRLPAPRSRDPVGRLPDEAMVVEHLVNIGRRNAIERTAHFFMELAERLTLVGMATETEFKCPLSQFVIADALGLTAIHVNRVLRALRELDLLTVRKGSVRIHDLARLRKLAGFQGGYLNSRE